MSKSKSDFSNLVHFHTVGEIPVSYDYNTDCFKVDKVSISPIFFQYLYDAAKRGEKIQLSLVDDMPTFTILEK